MIKNISKKSYILFMLATLPMTIQFNLLCKQSIPELIQEFKNANSSFIEALDGHRDKRKPLHTLNLADEDKGFLAHSLMLSLHNNKKASKCFKDLIHPDGTFKDDTPANKITVDKLLDLYHSCIDTDENSEEPEEEKATELSEK